MKEGFQGRQINTMTENVLERFLCLQIGRYKVSSPLLVMCTVQLLYEKFISRK